MRNSKTRKLKTGKKRARRSPSSRSRRGSAGSKPRKRPTFLAVDFFCGAGGTTRGLIDAGGYVVAGVDNDSRCRDTYVKNNTNASLDKEPPAFLNRDIFPRGKKHPTGEQQELIAELEPLLEDIRKKTPGTPLLFAICAPCQPFTKLARKELSDRRKLARERDSNLLREAAKFVARFNPDMILSENVQGIGDPKYGDVWKKFKAQLRRLGYLVGDDIVCCSHFGVPQYRKRSILLAVKRERIVARHRGEKSLDVPSRNHDVPIITVKQALSGLPALKAGYYQLDDPNHQARTLSETNLRRIKSARPGESNAYMDREKKLALDCHRKVNKRLGTRCFTDVYTRMHPDRPSPTITTKCHSISNGRFGHFDRRQNRGISLREAALLQSFPPNYVFYPTHQIEPIARMIGNAVPPRLAAFYSRHLTGLVERPRTRRRSRRIIR